MFNKSQIMKRAHEMKKQNGTSMSVALKASWAIAKAEKEAAEYIGAYSGQAKVSINVWEKYGKSRTYISCKHYTNAWNLKHENKIGYVDNMTGIFYAA